MNPRLNSTTHRALNEAILRMQTEGSKAHEEARQREADRKRRDKMWDNVADVYKKQKAERRAKGKTARSMQSEDIQTYERNREMARKSAKLGSDISKANTAYHSAGTPAEKRKADRAHEKAVKASNAHAKVQKKESGSKTLYGKGGKVIRKGTAAHKSATAKSERDWKGHQERKAEYGRKMETHPNKRVRDDWNAQMGGYRDADEASGRRAARDRQRAREMEGPRFSDGKW